MIIERLLMTCVTRARYTGKNMRYHEMVHGLLKKLIAAKHVYRLKLPSYGIVTPSGEIFKVKDTLAHESKPPVPLFHSHMNWSL